MQTILSLQRLGTVTCLIVRSSVSYCFPYFLPIPQWAILSPPFPCNSGWGSKSRFASATIWARSALPVPTIFPSKTGLYDICLHLNLTSEMIVSKPKSLSLGLFLVFVTPFALYKSPFDFTSFVRLRILAIFQVLQPE
jgi:hypothetical protein